MGVIWQKVWFDLWHNKMRTLLAVISIAVGVFAVGAIFGMNDQMLTAMDTSHRSDRPQHLTMYFNMPVDRDIVLALRKVPGVEDIESSNAVNIRYRFPGQENWHQGVMMMRDDYRNQKYQLLRLKAGAWPKGDGIAMEFMQADYYHVNLGDQVIFEIGKKEHALPVTGTIRHPFTPPPSLGYDLTFFFTDAAGMERFGLPQGKFTGMMARVTPYSLEHAKQVASDIKDRLATKDIGVASTQYQNPDKHWGRVFMDSFVLVLEVMAVVSLVLSTVLVLNTFMALITQQTNQIGMLKAVGGTSRTVIQIYLSGALVYGALALLISFPLGALTAFSVSQGFLALFNIPYEQFQISDKAIVFQLIAALVVPLLAALWPVLQGASISVREAMASYGLGGDFGMGRFDRLVERVGRHLLPSHYAAALANTFRRKGRLILTELVLVVAGAMFLMLMALNSSINATVDAELARRDYAVTVEFERIQRIDRAVPIAYELEEVEKAEMLFAHSVSILQQGQRTKEAGIASQLIGAPPEDPMYVPRIVAGRWIRPGDERVIVVNKEVADDNGLSIGDVVSLDLAELGRSDWEIIGLHKAIGTGEYSVNNVYAPRQAVLAATNRTGRGVAVLVKTRQHDDATIRAVADKLQALYAQRNMKVIAITTRPGDRTQMQMQFVIVVYMLLAMAILAALVGGIGQMGALSIGVIERTKEIGILRAVGARSGTIMRMFMLEGVLQGALSWLFALPISLVFAPLLGGNLGRIMFGANLEYQYDTQSAVLWLVVVLVIGALASIGPARSATKISVRQSLAYE
ncbi:MAG: ABC transporter permease [Chloroflexi bacterium]|nr:ABC transporter permease [Chloroflexota bacterium]